MAPSVISIGTTETNPSLARNVSYAIKVVTGEMNAHLSVQNRGALLFPPAFSVHCCDPFENWVPSFLGSKFPGFPGLVTWVSWPGSPDPGSWVLGPPGFLGPRNQEARIFVPRPLEPRKCAPGPFIDPGFFRFIVFSPFCLLKLLTHISPPFQGSESVYGGNKSHSLGSGKSLGGSNDVSDEHKGDGSDAGKASSCKSEAKKPGIYAWEFSDDEEEDSYGSIPALAHRCDSSSDDDSPKRRYCGGYSTEEYLEDDDSVERSIVRKKQANEASNQFFFWHSNPIFLLTHTFLFSRICPQQPRERKSH